MRPFLRRFGVVLFSSVALLAAGAGIASAHVTVSAPGAVRGGGDQLITFRVPTESESASTIGLKVQLPAATPIASVLVQPIAGWSFTETTSKLAKPIVTDDGTITEAVSEIDWKADSSDSAIGPGQFQEFVIIAGQLPDADSITFKAIQTYSDGSEVDWIETPAPGSSAEPDHPAPVLSLASSTTSPSSSSNHNTAAVILSIVALVVAVIALGLVILTRVWLSAARSPARSDAAGDQDSVTTGS
ncbi:MAG: YcnI family protein [Actinobacteria bacterium]|nr:YcnI family protein [Actinomycetota bacterium]